jgi:phosphoribosylamine---glycine ligase
VFHAGTEAGPDGTVRAAGGRVMTVCGTGPDLQQARDRAYAAIDRIVWPEGFCRRDIAAGAV